MIQQTGNENIQSSQVEVVVLIQHQILITYLQGNEWQLEGRINIQISGIKLLSINKLYHFIWDSEPILCYEKGLWLFRKGVWDYLWGMTSLKYLEGADYEINALVSYSELSLMGI